jgi:biopolymer transport protein ExbD
MALKKARRAVEPASLNITSMMDMMTIILVFLLKSYSTQDISVAPSEDLELPISTVKKAPEMAVNVIVSKKNIVVDGVPIVGLEKVPDADNPGQSKLQIPEDQRNGQLIDSLLDELSKKADTAKDIGKQSGSEEHAFKGRLLIQCDKKLPFEVLRQVMYTAGQAQFSEFKFVVYKQE